MSFVAVGVGGGMLAAGMIGSSISASKQAKSQGAAAAAQLAQQREDRDLALKKANSPDEIAQLQKAVNLNDQDISRQQRILDSTDPAVIEAGKQALQMMKGVNAQTLDPIRNQRAKDRQVLQDKLLRQLGPGYENTSAGIQALTQFDQATADSLNTAQQQAINSYLGVSSNFSGQGLSKQIAASGTLGGMYGNIASRNVEAIRGTPVNPALGFAGQIAQQQANQQTFGQIQGLGSTIMGAGLGGMGSGGGTGGGGNVNNLNVNGVAPAGGFNLGVSGGGSSGNAYSFGNMMGQ